MLMLVGLLLIIGCVFFSTEASAAKAKTITVTKIDQKTAKKMHKELMKGKTFKLKIKCKSMDGFYSKLQKLSQKVAKCTEYGFDIYPICQYGDKYCRPKKAGEYFIGTIWKLHCEEYIYGLKFAEREREDLKVCITQVMLETQELHDALVNGMAVPRFGYKDADTIIKETEDTYALLGQLYAYLDTTKFRDLSEAMKVRIVLEIGSNCRAWGKSSMRYEERQYGQSYTFKALYRRKAYGRCSSYARATCKICAVFHIGEWDYLSGTSIGENHAVVRVKLRTLGNNIRYVILSNGEIASHYNDYALYHIHDLEGIYRRGYKGIKSIKRIKEKTQQLKRIRFLERRDGVFKLQSDESFCVYNFRLSRDEW